MQKNCIYLNISFFSFFSYFWLHYFICLYFCTRERENVRFTNQKISFRAAKCYEDGLGTRKDRAKAVQYYR